MVDTGATNSRAPESMLHGLNIRPYDFDLVVIGDDTLKKMGLCTALIACQGTRRQCPIWAGAEDTEVLLGATTLEILGFKVDPVNGVLEPVSPRV